MFRLPTVSGSHVLATWKTTLPADLLASLVVFLVALPLCLGIAIASGAPPVAGLLSGIIGGLVVASLGGNIYQVSGPANSLIVVVALIVHEYGLAGLGVVTFLAGAMQLVAGLGKLGRAFQAVPPAVVHGLMAGFAVIIFASQFHVMLDDAPRATPLENLLAIPWAVWDAAVARDGSHQAAILGCLTIAILLAYKPLAPACLRGIPASLVAVAAATLTAWLGDLPVARVPLPDSLSEGIVWLDWKLLPNLFSWRLIELAATVAFLASLETLLCATAIDQLHSGPRTQYDRELAAQGAGNLLCGLIGAIPLTGVVIRSATNLAAGARTRLASVLHGAWMLILVVLFPALLRAIPTASLAAVLVVAVFKLIQLPALKALWQHDRKEIGIYAATALAIVLIGVLPGVAVGVGLAVAKLLFHVGYLGVRVDRDPLRRRFTVHLRGAATFLTLPKLAAALDRLPAGAHVHLRLDELHLIDHACFEFLASWEQQYLRSGGILFLNWNDLITRFNRPAHLVRPKGAPPSSAGRLAVPRVPVALSQTDLGQPFYVELRA
jgi:MFS superfamily sulfate permease-like transporter